MLLFLFFVQVLCWEQAVLSPNLMDQVAAAPQYAGESVVRVVPENASVTQVLQFCKDQGYDVWANSRNWVDVRVPRGASKKFKKFGEVRVVVSDVAAAVAASNGPISPESAESAESADFGEAAESGADIVDPFFSSYQSLSSIYAWYDSLVAKYSKLLSIEHVGMTFEGQQIKALYIDTSRFSDANPENKTIIITAGIHAREWISVSTAAFVVDRLLRTYGKSKKETEFLNRLNVLVIPVFNPDGYAYTWTHDRLWRKNRQETYVPRCFGIDLDHNFGYHWERNPDTFWPCDEDYAGEEPLEAIETEQFTAYLNSTKSHLKVYGYIDLHSYAQEILYPYAYSCNQEPRDKENLMELAYGLSKAIRLSSGKSYEVLPACFDKNSDLISGTGAGSSLDFMYSQRARWAFQFKLRDSGSHGFLLPPKYIAPVGNEVYDAVKYFLEFILDPEL